MRLFVVLSCFLACCLAQKPHPCKSPPLLTGAFTVSTQNEKSWAYAKYLYDAMGLRLRLMEVATYENKSITYDALMLYREAIVYEINYRNRTCKKRPLKADFTHLEIPKDASLVGQAVVGASSGPFEGLLVNTWTGDMPKKAGKWISTVTEFGCIPVSIMYPTDEFGWVVLSYFNNVIGITDPGLLNPPDFCLDAKESEEEPVDFLSFVRHQASMAFN